MSSVEWSSWLNDLEEATEREQYLATKINSGANVSKLSTKVRELQTRVASLDQSFRKLEPKTSAFTVCVACLV